MEQQILFESVEPPPPTGIALVHGEIGRGEGPRMEDGSALGLTGPGYRRAFREVEGGRMVSLYEGSLRNERRRLVIGQRGDPYEGDGTSLRTRQLLEKLSRQWGKSIWLITRSSRVERDLDLLHSLQARHRLLVSMLFGTLDEELAGKLEPGAESPARRLQALRRLSGAGIETGAVITPLLPALNDSLSDLECLLGSLTDAGIHHLQVAVLKLRGQEQRESFFRFVAESYPEREPALRRLYADDGELSVDYQRVLATRLRVLREKFGLREEPVAKRGAQLSFLGGDPVAA